MNIIQKPIYIKIIYNINYSNDSFMEIHPSFLNSFRTFLFKWLLIIVLLFLSEFLGNDNNQIFPPEYN
jgi:hypothetical protein